MTYDFGQWELDIDLYELRCAGQFIRLEPLVFDVLVYLVLNRDRVISKQELMSQVWPDQFIGDSALERCIMAARKAVGDSGNRQHVIKTFYRRGYRFIASVTERTPCRLPASQLSPPAHVPSSRLHPLGGHAVPTDNSDSVMSNAKGETERERDATAKIDLQPEHQKTTVLSGSLVCSDLTCSRAERPTLWEAFFTQVTHQVQAHGGLIAELRADSFLALFGTTGPSHDHALRAVQTALEVQELLNDERLKLNLVPDALSARMSLHTGDIISKQFRHEPRVRYMAVGDVMHFAATLLACTEPGRVFFSSTTHQMVQEEVDAEVVGLISVQAHDLPVPVYQLNRLHAQTVSRASTNF